MTTSFLPRDRQFWLYHCSAVLCSQIVNIVIAYTWGGMMVTYNVLSSIAWAPIYTAAVLWLRWMYKKHDGHTLPMGKVIPLIVLSSMVAGIVIAALVQLLVLPFFWDMFSKKFKMVGMTAPHFILQFLIDPAVRSLLFLCVWSFIYISVTTTRRVRNAEVFNLRLQNGLKEAQLSSLSSQVNPHFLFNSLNNIRFMVHEDARRADEMITSLSDILRYSLESGKQDKVTVGEELEIIRKYISIVKAQLEERLNFELDVPASIGSSLMPPMILQMLVENAVKHGLDNIREGGSLTLAISGKDDRLIFELCNDVPSVESPKREGMGIGLNNIKRRLHLLYGERATLNTVRHASSFAVTMTLPKECSA